MKPNRKHANKVFLLLPIPKLSFAPLPSHLLKMSLHLLASIPSSPPHKKTFVSQTSLPNSLPEDIPPFLNMTQENAPHPDLPSNPSIHPPPPPPQVSLFLLLFQHTSSPYPSVPPPLLSPLSLTTPTWMLKWLPYVTTLFSGSFPHDIPDTSPPSPVTLSHSPDFSPISAIPHLYPYYPSIVS